MNHQIALVTIHLNGLLLPEDTLAVEAFTDFSCLSFSDSNSVDNPDTSNLSESVLSVSFHNQNLNLRKGIYLYWSWRYSHTKGGNSGNSQDDLKGLSYRLIKWYSDLTQDPLYKVTKNRKFEEGGHEHLHQRKFCLGNTCICKTLKI